MKKLAALTLCLTLLLAALPGAALAADVPRIEFTNYYLDYFDNSIEAQQFFMQALTQNTIKFKLTTNLLSGNVVLEDGTTLSNMPGKASLDLAFNLKDKEAALDFKTDISKYKAQGKVYFTEKGLIVPRETIQSLAGNGATFPELGDLKQLPEYVIFPSEIKSSDWNELNKQLQMVQINSKQTEAIRALIQEILLTIPDQCYSYDGRDPVLDLTKIELDSPQLLDSLKAHKESLAEKVVAAMNQGTMGQQEFNTLKENTRKQIITGIDSLTIDDMKELAQMMPFDLEKCKITIGASRCDTDFAVKSDLPDNTRMSLKFQNTSIISSGTTKSLYFSDFTLRVSDVNLNVSVNGDSSVNRNQGQFSLNLSGSGGDKKNTVSGKLSLEGALDWSGKSAVPIPNVNSLNSKTFQGRFQNTDQRIRVFFNDQEIFFSAKEPWISDGNTMVQLSSMVEALGFTVDWQPPGTIVIRNDSAEDLTIYLGSQTYLIGDQEYQSNAVPQIIDGRTFIPLRVLTDYYKLNVQWDPVKLTIKLHS